MGASFVERNFPQMLLVIPGILAMATIVTWLLQKRYDAKWKREHEWRQK